MVYFLACPSGRRHVSSNCESLQTDALACCFLSRDNYAAEVLVMLWALAFVEIFGRTGVVADESSCTAAPLKEVLGALGTTIDSPAALDDGRSRHMTELTQVVRLIKRISSMTPSVLLQLHAGAVNVWNVARVRRALKETFIRGNTRGKDRASYQMRYLVKWTTN